ncbi:MAG TPA: hypothetical protein VFW78_03265 [Bacteroidia bacterium]|nr:hypothetical protein [Bacteroidia bacterium]
MKKLFIAGLIISCMVAIAGNSAMAQHVIIMKSGEKMTGEVKSLQDNVIKFNYKGNEMTFKVADVAAIEFGDMKPSAPAAGVSSTKGVSYVMAGRKMIKEPKIDNLTMEKGIVVVAITINKYGNVVKAEPGVEGSTTTSNYLQTKAKQAAESVKFDTSPTMPLEQKGTITITF